MNRISKSYATSQPGLLEVQGWFPGDQALRLTINGLRGAGYVRADASLPRDQASSKPGEDASGPTQESLQQMRILNTGIAGLTGGVFAAVVAVASGLSVPIAAGAALAVGLGSGGVMERIGYAMRQKQVAERDRQGMAGTLVLAMRVADHEHADEVTRIMRESGARRTTLVTSVNRALTLGVSSALWTG